MVSFKHGCYIRFSKFSIRDCLIIKIRANIIQLKEDFPQGNKILFEGVFLHLSDRRFAVQRLICGLLIHWVSGIHNRRGKPKITQFQENLIVLA